MGGVFTLLYRLVVQLLGLFDGCLRLVECLDVLGFIYLAMLQSQWLMGEGTFSCIMRFSGQVLNVMNSSIMHGFTFWYPCSSEGMYDRLTAQTWRYGGTYSCFLHSDDDCLTFARS